MKDFSIPDGAVARVIRGDEECALASLLREGTPRRLAYAQTVVSRELLMAAGVTPPTRHQRYFLTSRFRFHAPASWELLTRHLSVTRGRRIEPVAMLVIGGGR